MHANFITSWWWNSWSQLKSILPLESSGTVVQLNDEKSPTGHNLPTSIPPPSIKAPTCPRPRFEDLPLNPEHPKASAWGLWGDDDELGALNLITPDVVRRAREEIVHGISVSLNLPINVPRRPMNPRRKPCEHRIIAKGHANDDELDMNTQGSTHWDGLRHFPYSSTKQFYNGVSQDEISGPNASDKIGIQNIANNPIITRGVLLDWHAYTQRHSLPSHNAFTSHAIPLTDLQALAREQNITFSPGDILLIRTGWTAQYLSLSPTSQSSLGGRDDRASIGIEATEASIKWHWENQFAAVASDTVAYEAWPSKKEWGVSMHEVLLSGWGLPIGECFDLEELGRTCERLGRWSFCFVSQPLNVPGGVASPANAVAVF